jgi:hypothetical protein
MTRIAVLYTGEIRTIEITSPYFRKNILDTTRADIFATIQGELPNKTFGDLLKKYWRENLKSWQRFSREDYDDLQDELLQKMDMDYRWKHYLKTSGSMIEYYQLYLSFNKMTEYEKAHGFQYDYVIRLRTDVVVAQPLIIEGWISSECIQQRLLDINDISSIMSSLFSLERILLRNEMAEQSMTVNESTSESILSKTTIENCDSLIKYIQEGEYLLTIRKNVFYMGRRSVFEKISSLGITYGQWKNSEFENWWDAESQLATICREKGISIFDSVSRLEGESLYQYRRENYFDECGELRGDIPSVFCFICRG